MPLLIGACYMTLAQGIEIGPFSFMVIRMLIAIGVIRIILKHERVAGGIISLDWLMIALAGWAIISSVFHNDAARALVFRFGLVFNICGIYFLIRVFCQSMEDLILMYRIIGIILALLALEMINEKLTGYNMFSVLGGVSEHPSVRQGKIRAQGPFAHAILAGTVGSVSLPFMIALWQIHRKTALIGLMSCVTIIIASSSSSPILSGLVGMGALFMWPLRHRMRLVRLLAVFGYFALDIVMKAPAYYLMARVDPAGGSTGYHRARLIQSSIEHISEWWFAGTDYTRHWMRTGVSWSPDHTDITNYYIKMGVWGGLPLMLLFIAILFKAFTFIGNSLQHSSLSTFKSKFLLWALGASLFAHVVTCLAVSYFDQSFLFIYLALAASGSIWSILKNSEN